MGVLVRYIFMVRFRGIGNALVKTNRNSPMQCDAILYKYNTTYVRMFANSHKKDEDADMETES